MRRDISPSRPKGRTEGWSPAGAAKLPKARGDRTNWSLAHLRRGA